MQLFFLIFPWRKPGLALLAGMVAISIMRPASVQATDYYVDSASGLDSNPENASEKP